MTNEKKLKTFTFQYGSIQITNAMISAVGDVVFTFQYGSIQIVNNNYTFCLLSIYIPIWFYSNLV